jgi:hypothetical protein
VIESHAIQVNDESESSLGRGLRHRAGRRATRAMMTCLLERAARALKYSRRLARLAPRTSDRERFLRVESRHRVGAVDVLNVRVCESRVSRPRRWGTSSRKAASKRCGRGQQSQAAVMAEDPQTARAGHSGERLVTVTHGGRWP